ncbi:CcdC protein domain-containing protein [Plantactinospora sp. B6F1]|uniref:CcdC protein domain-containing protein n=1 Tax=Plantactinospora sp. B6F1 TaxID=3158971 RepID=UPI0010D8F4F3
MDSSLLAAVVVVGVIAVVVKRFVGEPLNGRDLAVPPLVLVGIGIYALTKVDHLTGTEIGWVVAGSVVGLVFGAVRGTTVRLFRKGGVLWQRYSGWTVAVWVASFAISAGLGYLAVHAGVRAEARPMTLSIGVSLLGELATLGRRALSTGVPFATGRR